MAWQPAFHWTDQELHVHAFYCILSLLFVSLAHRKVWKAGIEIGLPDLEKKLKEMKEVVTLQIPQSGKTKDVQIERVLTKMDKQQESIYNALELNRLAPK